MGISEIDQKAEEKSSKYKKVMSSTIMDHQEELNSKFISLTMDQPAELDNFMVTITEISSFFPSYDPMLRTVYYIQRQSQNFHCDFLAPPFCIFAGSILCGSKQAKRSNGGNSFRVYKVHQSYVFSAQ